MLVLAPLSILQPSWGGDIEKFTKYSFAIAHGTPEKRLKLLEKDVDIVVTNHDAVKWLAKHPKLLANFSHIVVDEFTAFKNRTSQRSRAIKTLTDIIPHAWFMSGTPNSNTILDIWYPVKLLDGGKSLGPTFWKFRSQVCEPVQVGPNPQHIEWRDKENIEEDVADLLKHMTIRFDFEECLDIPENKVSNITLEMPQWLRTKYETFIEQSYIETEEGHMTALHAGAKVKKALQMLSGAVYNDQGEVFKVHTERYALIMDLIKERKQCVIGFNYRHERANLVEMAEKQGVTYGVIDGSVKVGDRNHYISEFQNRKIQALFIHPKSGGHGLTLTAGTATIWASPTYDAEHYAQFNKRIHRAGQTKKTETIRIAYEGSKEIEVYEKLDGKMGRMEELLSLLQQYSREQ
tara:strand:- start:6524 stop:7738 length:1215 start_codon:yes stop_codon:yes gene_type:complete